MRSSVAQLLALFDQHAAPSVAGEDFDGPHGETLRAWQRLRLVAGEPGVNPAASCPHCGEGVPYRLDGRLLCNACQSTVDPSCLHLWSLDLMAFLRWIAKPLRLRGDVRPVEECLWHLGTGTADGEAVECFYLRSGPLSDVGEARLRAYRRVVVFHGPSGVPPSVGPGRLLPLLDLFGPDGSLTAMDLDDFLRPSGRVRFDAHSGALWAGDTLLGEVPVGSREYHLLSCLAEQLDHYVPYADLKREVLRRARGKDGADEATFCHGLKRRIKKKWVARIDHLLQTTNKADGYRLREYMARP